MSISAFLDTQESFQEAKMKDICGGDFWGIICQWKSGPYSTTVKTSCQSKDLEKPKHGLFSVLDTLAVTNSVNSGNSRPIVVCHLLSSCEHASITSKGDSEVFEFSEKFQKCAVVPSSVKLLCQQTKEAQSERSNRVVPEGEKKSQKYWSTRQPQTSKSNQAQTLQS
jgi:hypothetical protein